MVIVHAKHANETQFLFETTVTIEIAELFETLVKLYNSRRKIDRLCHEIEDLSKHGVSLPPEMQGLTADQIADFRLQDDWTKQYLLSNEYIDSPDPIGRRNGKAPVQRLAEVLTKTAAEAKAKVSKKLVEANICLTYIDIQDALAMLKGAVMIAYPMGLPQYDPVQLELENKEDLFGKQASLDVLEESNVDLWWAGSLLEKDKKLQEYIGKNEKTKIVVKLQKKGLGAPSREPIFTEEERRALLLADFHRREELKKLHDADDDSYLNSTWADNKKLQKSFQGLSNIKFHF